MPIIKPNTNITEAALVLYRLAKEIDSSINIFQPGLIREFIVAQRLGHDVNTVKREHDAQSRLNPNEKYEYLTAFDDGAFQIDRVKTAPNDRHQQLNRITRNHAVYCASFNSDTLDVLHIWEIDPNVMAFEANRQLDISLAEGVQIKHLTFNRAWVENNGTIIV